MKITLSKSQWQAIGKKAGWMKKASDDIPPIRNDHGNDLTKPLIDMIEQINKMQGDFIKTSANLPKDRWSSVGEDCDAVVQSLDNAAGRISTIIHKMK